MKRSQVEPFFRKLAPTEIVLEACGGSHHWGRTLAALGHRVRLIPPKYVKPFVKRGKNDRNDAQAISEAAARPSRRAVPVRSAEAQAEAMALSVRELLVKQRTQLVNALRGHACEFGVIAAKGVANAGKLVKRMEADATLPAAAKQMFVVLGREIARLDEALREIDRKLAAQHKANPLRSTGGKQRLGGISREGNERLRRLLVLGATSVIKVARPGNKHATPWLMGPRRSPRKGAYSNEPWPSRVGVSLWRLLAKDNHVCAARLPRGAT